MQELPPILEFRRQLILDFGPPLPYQKVCSAYTVEKLSLWVHTTENVCETVALKTDHLPRARVEGTLYYIPDEEAITALDNRRLNGVGCDRKFVPILLPFKDRFGEFIRSEANVYIGRNDFWVDRLKFTQEVRRSNEFILADQVMDYNKTLHNRFCFLPPEVIIYPEKPLVAGSLRPSLIQRMRKPHGRAILWQRLKEFIRDDAE